MVIKGSWKRAMFSVCVVVVWFDRSSLRTTNSFWLAIRTMLPIRSPFFFYIWLPQPFNLLPFHYDDNSGLFLCLSVQHAHKAKRGPRPSRVSIPRVASSIALSVHLLVALFFIFGSCHSCWNSSASLNLAGEKPLIYSSSDNIAHHGDCRQPRLAR